jgi:hypothetical protein
MVCISTVLFYHFGDQRVLSGMRHFDLQRSNASLQLLPKAGAERTLVAVSCKALLGGNL